MRISINFLNFGFCFQFWNVQEIFLFVKILFLKFLQLRIPDSDATTIDGGNYLGKATQMATLGDPKSSLESSLFSSETTAPLNTGPRYQPVVLDTRPLSQVSSTSDIVTQMASQVWVRTLRAYPRKLKNKIPENLKIEFWLFTKIKISWKSHHWKQKCKSVFNFEIFRNFFFFLVYPSDGKPNCSKTIIDMEKNFFVYGRTVNCPWTLIAVFSISVYRCTKN